MVNKDEDINGGAFGFAVCASSIQPAVRDPGGPGEPVSDDGGCPRG